MNPLDKVIVVSKNRFLKQKTNVRLNNITTNSNVTKLSPLFIK